MCILNIDEEKISKLEDISELQFPKIAGHKETQMGNINESLRNMEDGIRKYNMFLIKVSEWENRE